MKLKSTFRIFTFLFLFFASRDLLAQDGRLDVNFGVNGSAIIKGDNADDLLSTDLLAVCPDGSAVTSIFMQKITPPYYHQYLYKISASGKIDSSFGTNGRIEYYLSQPGDITAFSLAAQGDGKILINTQSMGRLYIMRFNSNGQTDAGFGNNGIAEFTNPTRFLLNACRKALVLQPDGKIIIMGTIGLAEDTTIVIRYNNNGTLDNSFNTKGYIKYVPENFTNYLIAKGSKALALQPDGKILFSTKATNGIARLHTDGTPDTGFGENGVVPVSIINGNAEVVYHINVLADGSFMCAGAFTHMDSDGHYRNIENLYRYDKDGRPDKSFGSTGVINIYAGIDYAELLFSFSCLAVQPDRRFIFGLPVNFDKQAERHDETNTQDMSFGINGFIELPNSNYLFSLSDLSLAEDKILANYNIDDYDKRTSVYVSRYNNASVLPITLTSFTTTKKENTSLLQWHTCSETNCKGFSIERSTDNKTFTTIGFAASKGGGNKCNNDYSFTDNTPANGINYYRLKVQDNDGKFSYSNIQNLSFNIQNFKFKITPNPVVNILKVEGLDESMKYELRIMNDQGREMYSSFNIQNTTFSIHVSSLPAGIYYLIAVNENGEKKAMKFIKQ